MIILPVLTSMLTESMKIKFKLIQKTIDAKVQADLQRNASEISIPLKT